jgi:hypothetical protein
MDNIREVLEKELIYAKAKVEVIEELMCKYAPIENPKQETEFTDFTDETQPTTDNTF